MCGVTIRQLALITVFVHDRVDDEPVTDQAFGDDARRNHCGFNTLFFATTAGAPLSLGHQHEVFGRFDVQLLAGLVANQILVFSALGADALFWRAGDDLFDPGASVRAIPVDQDA